MQLATLGSELITNRMETRYAPSLTVDFPRPNYCTEGSKRATDTYREKDALLWEVEKDDC